MRFLLHGITAWADVYRAARSRAIVHFNFLRSEGPVGHDLLDGDRPGMVK